MPRCNSLRELPLDVFVHIINHIPASRDSRGDSNVKILANCLQANSVLREAAILSSIWEPHYRTRYLHCNDAEESRRRKLCRGDWRLMYAERRRLDRIAVQLLDQMIDQRVGRYDHAKSLTEMSFDIWDVLELEAQCLFPEIFRERSSDNEVVVQPHATTRRFWAESMLQVIARTYAVRLWGRLVAPDNDFVSFEETLSALSCFFGKTPMEITTALDDLSVRCRNYLVAEGCGLDTDDVSYSLTNICTCICCFMHSQGFGDAESEHFHDILNHFPHAYLSTNKRTIPISLVHIFVAIARRLGIAASPVDFPARVLAHVSSLDPAVDDIYVDVFGSQSKPILSARDDIPLMLLRAGISPQSMMQYISPGNGSTMLLRAARNIFASHHSLVNVPETVSKPSIYAALCVHVLLTSDARLVSYMMSRIDTRPLDCATFLSDILAPALGPRCREVLEESCRSILMNEAEAASVVNLRSKSNIQLKFFVGLIFEHRIYGYIGCIIGWEATCSASEEWMIQMGIDSLPRGQHQPFYPVISIDGSERYVAEDNIKPLNPTREIVLEFFKRIPVFGMYFEDADLREQGHESGRGRLMLSPELRNAYPEDDSFGQIWVGGEQRLDFEE